MWRDILIYFLIAPIVACVIHEFGHWLMAKIFGEKIKFKFALGRLWYIPIPRWTWVMPWRLKGWRRRAVALAGFGLEVMAIALMPFIFVPKEFFFCYAVVAMLHVIAYPFYAGSANDFNYL